MRVRWSVCFLALLLGTGAALAGDLPAAPGSFRAAQDTGIDLSLRPVDLLNVDETSAAPGSFRAAQDAGLPWSHQLSPKWSLEGYQEPAARPVGRDPKELVGVRLKRDL